MPSSYAGTLRVVGVAGPVPSIDNQSIRADYYYELNHTQGTGSPTYSCSFASTIATTDSAGDFTANLTLLASGCGGGGCNYYSGPFAPVAFSVTSPTPAGYFVSVTVGSASVAVSWVLALDSVDLEPFGRNTVSESAPVTLTASPLAGDGTPSPATVTFNWTLTGSDWSILGGVGTSQFTIVSTGTGGAFVTIQVNGTYNGTALTTPVRSATLTPVPTIALSSSVDRSRVDVGSNVTFTIDGNGSGGYSYTATIYPGLSGTVTSAPCVTTFPVLGVVDVSCAVTLAYPSVGTVTASGFLSNGYSNASVSFASITVVPGLGVSIAPSPVLAYVGYSANITATVDTSTGTAPYGPACLFAGDGLITCITDGGPTWSFHHTYLATGPFDARITLADNAGANRSTAFAVGIVPTPILTQPIVDHSPIQGGTVAGVVASLAGGALPATFWWNDSLPASTVATGVIASDGPVTLNYTSSAAGVHHLNLTVVDRLGTRVAGQVTLVITPGPAVTLGSEGAVANWTVEAGAPYPIHWAALDAAGATVDPYVASVTIAPTAADGSVAGVWLNASWGGPELPDAGGTILLPPSSWHDGWLNFSIASPRAGPILLRINTSLPIADAPLGLVTLTVTPDVTHLALSDPVRAPTGSAINHTLWRIADRFANPLPSGYIDVITTFGGTIVDTRSPILWNGSASTVWVNFTVPLTAGGTVAVVSAFNQSLLGLLRFAGPSALSPVGIALVTALGAAALGCLAAAARRRRPPPAAEAEATALTDLAMKRLAEGRAHILSRADDVEPRTLAELIAGFPGRPPDPTEMTEWVSSLVAEGALRAGVGPTGAPVFVRTLTGESVVIPDRPRIETDAAALDAALAHRPDPDDESADR